MPPKGWRKNPEGSHPVSSKERDQISIDDILFPKATVNRLARAILPDGGLVSKDSSTALQRSATVFVSYLLVHARQNAKKFDRKTIGPQDVISALEQAEFSSFIPSVREELDSFQARKDAQKQRKREEKAAAASTTTSTTTGDSTTNNTDNTVDVHETIEIHDDSRVNGSNDTVDDNDSVETVDNDETQPENPEPVTKKLKGTSREDTVSEVDS